MKKQKSEAWVKDQCHDIFKEFGITYFAPIGSMYGRGGVSDYICCLRGRFIAVECKATEKHKTTRLQDRFLNDVRQAGGIALVVHDGNLDALRQILKSVLLGVEE